ncbi:MAG: molybdopterin-dependent oxidoreductase [Gammaproteobacteria bacterium]|nr:molybdopterin-dependent oxidoreductase [Gammaproteobacteria bacterium]
MSTAPGAVNEREKYVGQSVLRLENPPLLKGEGKFIDDLPVSKKTHHAAIVRSPHAHANIVSIDVAEALKQPGVSAVITGDDVKQFVKPLIVGFKNDLDYRGIALDRVRYVGEPVAVVCAEDRYKAEDALDYIRVEYEPLPAVVDPVEAAAEDAPVLHPKAGSNVVSRRVFRHGEIDQAFEQAPRHSEMTVRYPRNSITPMETYAIVAEHFPDSGAYDVISNFQGPFSVHTVMAIALGVPGSRLRHRSPPNSGGSFGSKLTIFPYIVLMCVASRVAKRPIKWIEDRLEHLSAANSAPNRVTNVQTAFDDNGIVTGLKLHHWDDHGAYLRAPMPAPIYRMHGLSTNGYGIRNVEVINHIMVTNKCPTGAVRGFGGPQLYFAIERMMHKIAVELGLDPLELMQRNLVRPDAFPYKAPAGALLDSGNYQKTIQETVDQGGLQELKERCAKARSEGRLYGIGYASAVEPSQSNMGYISTLKTGEEREKAGPKDGAVASVTIMVDALGSVSVIGDSVPQGQGHQTVLAQIVADELGLNIDNITVNLETDTQKDGWSIAAGNYSCRFAPASTSAAHDAACKVRDKLARIASQTLNLPPEKLEFVDGRIQAIGNPENWLDFRRVGGLAHWSPSSLPDDMEPHVRESSSWNAPELTPTNAQDEINTSLAYGFGFDYCGIEIDRDTGQVRVDKYVTAHDCGTILNPGIAEGQIRGSFAAAIGATLYEEFVYDPDGTFLSGTFADYLVATAPEMPELTLIHPTPNPSPFTRLGAKGIAEGNQYTTPVCIANAVADALGREDIVLPLSPKRVAEWIYGPEPPPPSGIKAAAAPAKGKGHALTGEGSHLVSGSPEDVWQLLIDPKALAAVIPGCRELNEIAPQDYRGTLALGVGPVRGEFETSVKLTDLDQPNSLTLNGQLVGPLGSSSGQGLVKLKPEGDSTRIGYQYQIQLAGKVAAVGGRMLDGAARALMAQFFKALTAKAAGEEVPVKRSWWRALLAALGFGR